MTQHRAEHEHPGARRRSVVAGIASIVVLIGGMAATALITSGERSRAERPTTTGPQTTPPPTTEPEGGPGDLVVMPSTGLRAGDEVRFRAVPAGSGTPIVAQCAREVLDRNLTGSEPLSWCRSPDYEGSNPYRITRAVPTTSGRVDCAEEAGQCVLALRFGGPTGTDNRWAPLTFTPAGPLPEPKVRIIDKPDGTTIADGAEIRLRLSGFSPGASVFVSQCRDPRPIGYGIAAKGPVTPPDCDHTPGTAQEPHTIGPDGTLTVAKRVWGEIFTDAGWKPCEPCEVRVTHAQSGFTSTPRPRVGFDMEAATDPEHPELEVITPGPHRPLQEVRVRGTGFRRSGRVTIRVCPSNGAGTVDGPNGCYHSPTPSTTVRENGTVDTRVTLPPADHPCAQRPSSCGLTTGGSPPNSFSFTPLGCSA